VGSNAFGVEEVAGVRKHAFAHYLDLVVDGRVDLRPMLTHTFRLEQWPEAAAAALWASGVRRGDRVGIWSPNRAEWLQQSHKFLPSAGRD